MKLKAWSSLKESKREQNVIRNVHVLGFESKNGYKYNKEAVKKALSKYEGKPVYLNHKHVRNVEDKIGLIAGVKFDETTGIWADKLILNEAHPTYSQIMWWADNQPNQIGLSHSIEGELDKDAGEVKEITEVESADLVSSPATVSGLHEAIALAGDDKNRLDKLLEGFYADSINLIIAGGSTEQLLENIQTFANAITPKETEMDLSKLTVEELRKLRPDLVETVVKDAVALERKIQDAIAKVPEKARTEIFIEQVRAVASDDKKLEAVVNDRIEIAKQTVTSTPPPPSDKSIQETEEQKAARIKEETKKALGL